MGVRTPPQWSRRAAVGIAGSALPECEGCFLARDEFEADFFVRMNNTGGPVDVWEVSGVHADELVESAEGFVFLPRVVAPEQLRLVRRGVPPEDWLSRFSAD